MQLHLQRSILPVSTVGVAKRGSVLFSVITATFTGPRQTSLFPKAARAAAPCATYCYHAVRLRETGFTTLAVVRAIVCVGFLISTRLMWKTSRFRAIVRHSPSKTPMNRCRILLWRERAKLHRRIQSRRTETPSIAPEARDCGAGRTG